MSLRHRRRSATCTSDPAARPRCVSTGPAGGNGSIPACYRGSSADGTRVFFTTDEQLVTADTDSSGDVYERSGGTTTLVSTGPAGGNGAFDADLRGHLAVTAPRSSSRRPSS